MLQRMPVTRREMLKTTALSLVALPGLASVAWALERKTFDEPTRTPYRGSDDQLLDEIERAAFDFFWNEAGDATGLVRDRALLNGNDSDHRRVASIAATGFGLTGLCIAESRGYGKAAAIRDRVHRAKSPLKGKAEIGLKVGEVLNRHKMAKHFELDITDAAFSFTRKSAEIAAEAATDGVYVIRTSLPAETFDDATTVRSYKSLALVERAFRCIKTVDLHVRPVYHRLADRVRAHVFLCMLAYYLEWHMRQKLAPMLFDDTDKDAAEAARASVVAPA